MITRLAAIAACLSLVIAHGSHSQEALADPAEDWALYHLQEEHRKQSQYHVKLTMHLLMFPVHRYIQF